MIGKCGRKINFVSKKLENGHRDLKKQMGIAGNGKMSIAPIYNLMFGKKSAGRSWIVQMANVKSAG